MTLISQVSYPNGNDDAYQVVERERHKPFNYDELFERRK